MTADDWARPRRIDRAIKSQAEIEAFLERAPFGFTATAVDDQPFLHVGLFWYESSTRRVYFHTAREGRTRENVLANPRVCFGVAEIGRLLPADTALEFSNEYASVIAFGRARIVDDPEEKRRGLQGLLDKYFADLAPGRDYRPITSEEMARTSVFAVEIEAWSGKQKVAPT
jgi:nitroimidazol reductase NimA-like FMN-containing flavoprotein (pyridoxamine 5'-phosphate oxidase superfamily)